MVDLRPLYREMVEAGGNFHGLSILQHQQIIGGLIQRTNSRSLLDYGCGAGAAYCAPYQIQHTWCVDKPAMYDPAFPSHDALPSVTFDGVLCSDVLEHVPVESVDEFIDSLFSYANKFVWASVCCRAAKKRFPDGTNLHVTIRPFAWWESRFKERSGGKLFWLTETP